MDDGSWFPKMDMVSLSKQIMDQSELIKINRKRTILTLGLLNLVVGISRNSYYPEPTISSRTDTVQLFWKSKHIKVSLWITPDLDLALSKESYGVEEILLNPENSSIKEILEDYYSSIFRK